MVASAFLVDWGLWLLKYFPFLIPPSIILLAVRAITAHSVSLFGQRIHRSKAFLGQDVFEYRLAVQNNEDEPLLNQSIVLDVLDHGGEIVSSPNVLLGCNEFQAVMNADRKSWRLDFRELPAYDTWTIVVMTNRAALNLRLTVSEGEAKLSGNRLFLPGDRSSVMTGQTTTEWWWGSLALALGLAIYGAVVLRSGLTAADAWFAGSLVTFTGGLFLAGRLFSPRVAPPLSQGYWRPVSAGGNPSRVPEAPHD